jgi:hypothetical protein
MQELYAVRGFSANGVDCVEGQVVTTETFDKQTQAVLIGMGRLAYRDPAEPELPIEPETTGKGAKGLPPLK